MISTDQDLRTHESWGNSVSLVYLMTLPETARLDDCARTAKLQQFPLAR